MRAAIAGRVSSRQGVGVAVAAALLAASSCASAQGSDLAPFTLSTVSAAPGVDLPSAQVNDAHGCKGGNLAPDMQWSAPPPGTKSFAVTFFDVTARHGAGFWHWALFDIPPATRILAAKGLPKGAEAGRNDFGDLGYGGACPPKGETHTYKLTVWALGSATFPFASGAPDGEIGAYVKAHAIAEADLTFPYKR